MRRSSWTIRCHGSPRARALRVLSSWKNDGAAGGDDGAGQGDQLAAVPPRPGSDDRDAAGPQQGGAAGEDLGDAVQKCVEAVMGEVDRVAAVAELLNLRTPPVPARTCPGTLGLRALVTRIFVPGYRHRSRSGHRALRARLLPVTAA